MTEPEHGTPEYWVRTRPDTPAVIKGHEVLTYGEWNERGDRVAEGLAGWAVHDVGLLITVGQPAGSPGVRYEDLLDTPNPTPWFGALRPNAVLYTSGTTGAPRGVQPLDPTTVDLDSLIRYRASVASVPPYPDDCG